MVDDVRQYGSAKTLLDKLAYTPANAYSDFDKTRLRVYALTEDLYNNSMESFRVIVRTDDDEEDRPTEIYVPNARKIVEATSRFLGVDFGYELSASNTKLEAYLTSFWEREAVSAKFVSQKRWGLVRGDQLWMISAKADKDEWDRLSLHEIDPSTYFPIEDPDDPKRIIGCYLVDEWQCPGKPKGEMCARVQKWLRVPLEDEQGPLGEVIQYSSGLYETGKWDEREMAAKDIKLIQEIRSPVLLPDPIDKLPIYHVRIRPPQNGKFGRSLISGVETLFTSVNQAASDEDLSLAVAGLGFYMTDGGPPRDSAGNIIEWEIGPLRVVEVGQGKNFQRVSGVASVEPSQKHIEYLEGAIGEGTGVPDIAVGVVDTAVAESGISLSFKLGPILAGNAEIELEMRAVLNQMWHDLIHKWIPAYEEIDVPDGIEMLTVFGDPRPKDNDKRFEQILMLVEAKLMSPKTAIKELNKIGWDIDENDFDAAVEASKKIAQASDPFSSMMAGEQSADLGNNGQEVPVA